jgi:hypothetical protein
MTTPLFPSRPRLRLVPREPQAVRPRLAVRVNVFDGRSPFGRAGPFRLTESDVNELIAIVTRMERRA